MSTDDASLKKLVEEEEQLYHEATASDGPFPLRIEAIPHFGTVQQYKCWQRGPNSQVYLTLPELWSDVFTLFEDREFLLFEGERYSYKLVRQDAVALAQTLRKEFGVKEGVAVALAARNYPEFVVAFIAVTGFLGGLVVPINSWWTGDELKYGLKDSRSAVLIADLERLKLAKGFIHDLNIRTICIRAGASAFNNAELEDCARFEDVLHRGCIDQMMPQPMVQQGDAAMLMYTSGTIGSPKGVLMTQRGVMAAINMIRLLNYSPGMRAEEQPQTVQLVPVPLFHVNGTHNMLLSGPSLGKKLILMSKWNATEALYLIEREKVNMLFGVPTMTYELLNHPKFTTYNTSSLLSIGGGGAPFAAPMVKEVARSFQNASAGTGYGLTETNSTVTLIGGQLFAARPSSVGRPVWNISVCVLGEGDVKLPRGGVGEVCVHGAIIMDCYLNKPDKTEEAFHIDREGKLWFRTGDIGRLDENNFLYIMDRAKDIIIRGGENISCAEVEAAAYEHRSVAEIAAFGVPDERLGELVGVAITFKIGIEQPSDEELQSHFASRLAAFKLPKVIIRWPDASLPRGSTGKIQKRDIKEKALSLVGLTSSKSKL